MQANERSPWWLDVELRHDPSAREAAAGEVLVGLGDPLAADGGAIVLTPKYRGSRHRSVAEFVLAADADRVAAWRRSLAAVGGRPRRVVLEDLSLDSCVSLLLLDAVLAAGAAADLPRSWTAWCEYVTRWEQGYTRESGPPDTSVAQLVTALGHSYVAPLDGGAAAGVGAAVAKVGGAEAPAGGAARVDATAFADGARDCLALLAALLAQQRAPDALDWSAVAAERALGRARTHLAYELEQYQRALRHGRVCQLSVPLAGSGRPVLVDALFIEERVPGGLLKVFARNDREHSWSRRGFELLGVHRPLVRGTGNDMVISVSRESGLTLESLWRRLEQREDEAWQGARPCDRPRPIRSYAGAARSPNEPWWDDSGEYTLIAAPKAQGADGPGAAGSLLDWRDDVLAAVWHCYSPIPRELRCTRELDRHGKVLALCRWPADGPAIESAASVTDSPTFRAWLKSLSSPAGEVTSVDRLPSARSYKAVEFDGGQVVVHHDGATVFDDWTRERPPLEAIRAIFADMADAWFALAEFHHGSAYLAQAATYQHALLHEPRRFSRKAFEAWKRDSWKARSQLLESGSKALQHADPWPLDELRARLSEMLGVGQHREDTLQILDSIDQVSSEIGAHLRERRNRVYRSVGAGLALAFTGKQIVEALRDAALPSDYQWQIALTTQPRDLQWLGEQVQAMQAWDTASTAVALAGLVLGAWLSYFLDARMSD